MTLSPRACTIWFTGLCGHGKTMVREILIPALLARGCKSEILDDEVVRVDMNWDLVLSPYQRAIPVQHVALVCLQSPASGKFAIFPAGAFNATPDESQVVCDIDRESPHECAQKILRQLERLECFAPYWNHERRAYSADEEEMVTQRLEALGYA